MPHSRARLPSTRPLVSDPITLRWVAGVGFGSNLIEWFSHARFSHVGALLPDGSELGSRDDVIQGIPAGVQIRPPNYEPWRRTLSVTLPATEDQCAQFWAWLHSQIGKPYDQVGILGFAADRNWREEDSWFCSEIQTAALEKCDWFSHLLAVTESKITPGDLLLLISDRVQVDISAMEMHR